MANIGPRALWPFGVGVKEYGGLITNGPNHLASFILIEKKGIPLQKAYDFTVRVFEIDRAIPNLLPASALGNLENHLALDAVGVRRVVPYFIKPYHANADDMPEVQERKTNEYEELVRDFVYNASGSMSRGRAALAFGFATAVPEVFMNAVNAARESETRDKSKFVPIQGENYHLITGAANAEIPKANKPSPSLREIIERIKNYVVHDTTLNPVPGLFTAHGRENNFTVTIVNDK